MATAVDNLIAARDSLSAQLAAYWATQVPRAAEGKLPKISYSLDGESFTYLSPAQAAEQIKTLSQLIADLDPGEAVLHGWN